MLTQFLHDEVNFQKLIWMKLLQYEEIMFSLKSKLIQNFLSSNEIQRIVYELKCAVESFNEYVILIIIDDIAYQVSGTGIVYQFLSFVNW